MHGIIWIFTDVVSVDCTVLKVKLEAYTSETPRGSYATCTLYNSWVTNKMFNKVTYVAIHKIYIVVMHAYTYVRTYIHT